ncbi:MAG TPA: 16S rRNA (adenine(1518)-N(6)/adenine(1519)-N(6))-dimethyltransferase RsmA [Candidatus Paceibacterota bacterium]
MKAKKHLGQHFLADGGALAAMVAAAEVRRGDSVLEIGPGTGSLTEFLLATGARVTAVEKDRELLPALEERFTKEISSGQLKIVEADALVFDIDSIFPHTVRHHMVSNGVGDDEKRGKEKYKLVANIPYYITGAILSKYLGAERQPSRVAVLVQREVAERIVARSGRESILSVSVKIYGDPRIARRVPRGAFRPPPTVDSAILAIDKISRERLGGTSDKRFFEVLKAGFAHPRKFVRRNLGGVVSPEKMESCGVGERARAEELPLSAWVCLALGRSPTGEARRPGTAEGLAQSG